jgi:hypothetical protein
LFQKIIVFIFRLYSKSVWSSFEKKLDNPRATQECLKREIETSYNKSQRFKDTKVPFSDIGVVDFKDLEKYVDGGLFNEKIICFEKTSGSSGQSKSIPYNSKVLKSFSRMFVLWAEDILSNIEFRSFKFYFSITPQFGDSEEDSGLSDDGEYLGGPLSLISKSFIVQIPNVKSIKNSDEFLMKLALILISNRKLEIISIWSPTYLLTLLQFIKDNEDKVRTYLSNGEFKGISFSKTELKSFEVTELFPSLQFISSWGSASAEKEFNLLKDTFKNCYVQKKGLLATEAPMTIPIFNSKGAIPLIDEVFFEFFDDQDNLFFIDEIEINCTYRIVISQKAGLIRYNIKDCVEVVGFKEKTPLLEFVGRRDSISDMFGEKVHENDAAKAILNTSFKCMIPSKEDKCYYCIYDSKSSITEGEIDIVESVLNNNIHYKNSRMLKQLLPLKTLKVDNLDSKIEEFHRDEYGINKGDLKVSALYFRGPSSLLSFLKAS